MEIPVGKKHTQSWVVEPHMLASALGSGLVDVFATPMLVALLELAASECIAPCLDEGMVSVGGHVQVSHTAATPPGMSVRATAEVTAVEGRRVDFSVFLEDDVGEIGSGTHTRFIVGKQKFTSKAYNKLPEQETKRQ